MEKENAYLLWKCLIWGTSSEDILFRASDSVNEGIKEDKIQETGFS